MQKIALLSIGYNRPEMLKLSMESISRCDELDTVQWILYLDGGAWWEWVKDFCCDVVTRETRWGLTKNILCAIKEQFDTGNEIVIVVESDVLVSRDFIRFIKYCMNNLKTDDILSVSGYIRDCDYYDQRSVFKTITYNPWGVAYDQKDYSLYCEHIGEAYFSDMEEYVNRTFPIKAWANEEAGTFHFEQAAIIKNTMLNNGKYQINPCLSRCQNIGYYGTHVIKPNGIKYMSDTTLMRKAYHHTELFHESYEWNELCLVEQS